MLDLPIYLFRSDSKHLLIVVKAYITKGIKIGVILDINKLDRLENNIAL